MKTQCNLVLLAAAVIGGVALFPFFPKTAKPSGTSRLTKAQMAAIRGSGVGGCETYTDTTSCRGGWRILDPQKDCIRRKYTTLRPKGPGETEEAYQAWLNTQLNSSLLSCDQEYDKVIWHKQEFTSARVGDGSNTSDVVEGEPVRCGTGVKCKGSPSPGTKPDPYNGLACVRSANPLDYCTICSSEGVQTLPDTAQPKAKECQGSDPETASMNPARNL